ncbi:TetR/AcrR family transcriptional regulator [Amycolatopsis regifaucium]|uniref:TetR family transcriptional regulator n=1 Tax=Amycolatopsis regifaucium TaxID=546365 RepID=A0A154MC87_9PSEU|nr:TetR/AcrR family transcriptional regulator [Amycolatopsis regifaucium]KZB82218.1 TetR family transcriptional regulator [Amycolatopsis regifaucium]OKA05713.1 TetR family transcriptional regulator [Amycolatopsis regifaucium]SFG86465.1 DNA-binding transcriptional regulator, AcrR family [Amycolatopsis regifaucium]
MAADPETRLRADARRNRDQILAAAREIFAAQGAEVPMEEIARAAGVGVGTLYRRFPDRDALIRAVAVDNFDKVLKDAKAAKDQESSNWDALIRLLHQSMELQLSVQLAMVSQRALAILKSDPAIKALRDDLLVVLGDFVQGAQAEGKLRTDVATGDVAMLFAMLLRQMPSKGKEVARMATRRCIGIMIDGLRAGRNEALPGRALTSADLDPSG